MVLRNAFFLFILTETSVTSKYSLSYLDFILYIVAVASVDAVYSDDEENSVD